MKYEKIISAAVAALTAAAVLSACGKTESESQNNSAPVPTGTSISETEAPATETITADTSTESKPEETKAAKSAKKTESAPKTAETAKAVTTTRATATTAATSAISTAIPTTTTPASTTTTTAKPADPANPSETLPNFTPIVVEGDPYAGSFVERTSNTATMEITNIGNNNYSIHITWPVNQKEVNIWDLSGEFDGRANLRYTNCRKTTAAYDANGNYTVGTDGIQTPFTTYTAGSGNIRMTDEGVEWTDDMGDIAVGTLFRAVATNGNNNNNGNNNGPQITDEPDAQNDIPYGNFYDGNGSKTWLDITDFAGTYHCTITSQDGLGRQYTWTFSGVPNADGVIEYSDGRLDQIIYDEYGNISSYENISKEHSGSLYRSNTGIVWYDSDGSQYVFINSML